MQNYTHGHLIVKFLVIIAIILIALVNLIIIIIVINIITLIIKIEFSIVKKHQVLQNIERGND
jgi:hypothetical protein